MEFKDIQVGSTYKGNTTIRTILYKDEDICLIRYAEGTTTIIDKNAPGIHLWVLVRPKVKQYIFSYTYRDDNSGRKVHSSTYDNNSLANREHEKFAKLPAIKWLSGIKEVEYDPDDNHKE